MNNIINIKNYEAFWVDYLDGKLSESEEEMLFDFLEENHHLASNLIDSEAYKIPCLNIEFPDKEKLFSRNQTENMLIAKIENAISKEDDDFIKEKIKEDANLAKELELYKKTILTPDKSIVYPLKKELYKSQKRTAFKFTPYMAAALILLIGIAGLYILNNYIEKPEFEKDSFVEKENKDTLKSDIQVIKNYYNDENISEQTAENLAYTKEIQNTEAQQHTSASPTSETIYEYHKKAEKLPVIKTEHIKNNIADSDIIMQYRIDFPENEILYSYTLEIKVTPDYEKENAKSKVKDWVKGSVRKIVKFRQDFDIKETYEKIRDSREELLTTNK
jgi:hypothetical protein